MALLSCKNCGENVSDKAKVCPHCGTEIHVEISEAVCKECGAVLPLDADTCPQCGCPIQKKISLRTYKKPIIIISILLVIIIGVLIGVRIITTRKSNEEYAEKLDLAASTMLSGAANAESAGNLIKSVWYNTIHEISDSKTDQYTKIYGNTFWDSFNDSLALLFMDSNFVNKISNIESNKERVSELMKQLINPPPQFADAHEALKDLYDAYFELTELATNPSGNYNTFSSNFNSAQDDTLKYYNAMKMYIE